MVAGVLAARRAGVRTAMLSNSWGENRYDRAQLERLFDAWVISGEVGLRKPDPAIYAITAERIGGLPPRVRVRRRPARQPQTTPGARDGHRRAPRRRRRDARRGIRHCWSVERKYRGGRGSSACADRDHARERQHHADLLGARDALGEHDAGARPSPLGTASRPPTRRSAAPARWRARRTRWPRSRARRSAAAARRRGSPRRRRRVTSASVPSSATSPTRTSSSDHGAPPSSVARSISTKNVPNPIAASPRARARRGPRGSARRPPARARPARCPHRDHDAGDLQRAGPPAVDRARPAPTRPRRSPTPARRCSSSRSQAAVEGRQRGAARQPAPVASAAGPRSGNASPEAATNAMPIATAAICAISSTMTSGRGATAARRGSPRAPAERRGEGEGDGEHAASLVGTLPPRRR